MSKPNLYQDLEKWQASNDPRLVDRKPVELFEKDFAIRYSKLHELIWIRLIRLHETLVTMEQLDEFPFTVIYAPGEMSFWNLVAENFRDMYCVILHSLLSDQGSDANTLRMLKNEIFRATWKDSALQDVFRETLSKCKFDDEIRSIELRLSEIRDHRVAHELVDRRDGGLKGVMKGVDLSEMRQLFDETHKQFGALSFGSTYPTLSSDLMPGTVGGRPKPSCLDSVLEMILRESHFVNQPERRASWWKFERESMTSKELELLNCLRAKVGLLPA